MIKRYQIPELNVIWSEEQKYKTWLLVEITSLEAYQKHNNQIKSSEIKAIKDKAKINVNAIENLEKTSKHDVIAFIEHISAQLGPEKRWFHYGLTSTDVIDTAQSYSLKIVNNIIGDELKHLIETLKQQAIEYQTTFQIGRTHGVHAEITTFGYKLALWYDEMQRNLTRFNDAAKNIEIAKISGAVGNYANVPLEVQDYVAKKLQLGSSKISTQTLQRDRHAAYFQVLALIGASLDKIAVELRHLQKTEVREVLENFSPGQKGSSAMPHKQNPISSENISGLSRLLKSYAQASLDNVSLWHERDISHSSAERIMFPDATTLVTYMLKKMNHILKNMYVDKQRMLQNICLTYGTIFSQRIMLYLIDKKGYERLHVYEIIQKIARKAFYEQINFGELLIKEKLLNSQEYKKLSDLNYYLENIALVFKRLKII